MSHAFDLDPADPAQSGVYAVATYDLDSLAALARDAGLRVLRVELGDCGDKRRLLIRLAAQLDFPPSFGRNWDALSDALRDLDWLPSPGGYALLLDAADQLREQSASDFAHLLEVLDEAASAWRGWARPFIVFVGLNGPEPTGTP